MSDNYKSARSAENHFILPKQKLFHFRIFLALLLSNNDGHL